MRILEDLYLLVAASGCKAVKPLYSCHFYHEIPVVPGRGGTLEKISDRQCVYNELSASLRHSGHIEGVVRARSINEANVWLNEPTEPVSGWMSLYDFSWLFMSFHDFYMSFRGWGWKWFMLALKVMGYLMGLLPYRTGNHAGNYPQGWLVVWNIVYFSTYKGNDHPNSLSA